MPQPDFLGIWDKFEVGDENKVVSFGKYNLESSITVLLHRVALSTLRFKNPNPSVIIRLSVVNHDPATQRFCYWFNLR